MHNRPNHRLSSRKTSKTLCLAAMALALLLAPLTAIAQETGENKNPGDYELGKFTVFPWVEVFLNINCNGNSISQTEDGYRSVSYDQLRKDFPLPGHSTLKIDLFTGGANCCNAYYLLTSSDKDSYAAYIEPIDAYLVWDDNRYLINDPYFMYYEPDFAKGQISFSRVNSPRPNRLLLFENGRWRTDRPGEFVNFYMQQLTELDAEKGIDPLARDILKAYYLLMSGQSVETSKIQFMANPVKEYQSYYPQLFQDISEAIGYNPVKNLNCQ